MPAFSCKFNVEGLCGHLLAVADEGGSVRLLDTRKLLSDPSSLVSGESLPRPQMPHPYGGYLSTEIVCFKNAIFDLSWVSGSKLVSPWLGFVQEWGVTGFKCLADSLGHFICGPVGCSGRGLSGLLPAAHGKCEISAFQERRAK